MSITSTLFEFGCFIYEYICFVCTILRMKNVMTETVHRQLTYKSVGLTWIFTLNVTLAYWTYYKFHGICTRITIINNFTTTNICNQLVTFIFHQLLEWMPMFHTLVTVYIVYHYIAIYTSPALHSIPEYLVDRELAWYSRFLYHLTCGHPLHVLIVYNDTVIYCHLSGYHFIVCTNSPYMAKHLTRNSFFQIPWLP